MQLRIKDLQFKFKTMDKPLFQGFDLELAEGKILAVLGQSGSGKSTLLRIIAGLEDRAGGTIQVGGRTFQDRRRFLPVEKRNIGFLFQDYALFPFLTVEQNIGFGMKRKDRKRTEELLELTRLEGLGKRYPHQLSGGQQQRAALARTLGAEPALLLMDEPFSNLDTALVADMRRDLKEIIRKKNMTTIFVTHNREDAEVLADQWLEL
ncbi:ABC transporter ATP-binding protein [Anaerotalea alkaliphila]|uniref:ATP-binding cassette domain-containing protein n=1 Tax=Anaerotalea alkaliphila TaxID=2662126 RepID=A0A7X5HV83_9FIRM|nr:ATP-binding cassette domain-containing protein [Anaerotalea alkaliphila]NDL67275.1 ATP-binding cassette domain-containing protein [Anaerotalea alkaliphila]